MSGLSGLAEGAIGTRGVSTVSPNTTRRPWLRRQRAAPLTALAGQFVGEDRR